MKTYRIYTEDIHRELVVKILSKEFENFTLLSGTGCWKTEQERALVIEIIGECEDGDRVTVIAKIIKRINKQKSVLITETETRAIFV